MNFHIFWVKPWVFATTSILVGLAQFSPAAQGWPLQWGNGWGGNGWAEDDRATSICIDAASARGFRVEEVIEQNEFSGGSEVILQVRGRNQSALLGCDYADNTRQVQLYQLQNGRDDWESSQNDEDDDFEDNYAIGDVNNRREAEAMARQVIEDELGVDADSDVIRIDETRRNRQIWYVAGDVNGAPFEVEIRRDGSVEDFRLR